MNAKEINLLPPQEVRARVRAVYLKALGQVLRAMITAGVLAGVALGGLGGMLEIMRAELGESGDGSDIGVEVISKLENVGGQVRQVEAWRATRGQWLGRAQEVLDKVPVGVQVSQMSLVGVPQGLEVQGVFGRRESLVAYQRSLEEIAWVKRVDAPLSNFQTGVEQKFSVTLFDEDEKQ